MDTTTISAEIDVDLEAEGEPALRIATGMQATLVLIQGFRHVEDTFEDKETAGFFGNIADALGQKLGVLVQLARVLQQLDDARSDLEDLGELGTAGE